MASDKDEGALTLWAEESTVEVRLDGAQLMAYEEAISGGNGQIRTADLPLRRRTLYPAELRPHFINSVAF
jgi:hypothetical protein